MTDLEELEDRVKDLENRVNTALVGVLILGWLAFVHTLLSH